MISPGVQEQVRGVRKPVDFVERQLQGAGDILVGRFVEADVAVADLDEAEARSSRSSVGGSGEKFRRWYAPCQAPQQSGARPGHTTKKVSPVDAIVVMAL